MKRLFLKRKKEPIMINSEQIIEILRSQDRECREKAWKAYELLRATLANKKATKADLIFAMQNAVEHLEEIEA